ncbi:MAG: hypothetical protein NC416_12830 [Eubacterium sp.]|nr:hypothetical protein [Eubacterium sp.]
MVKRKQKRCYIGGSWWRKIRLNRKHKDKLFRYLFKDKRHLLDLYNALHETDYADPEELEVVTMEDVIFMKMKNDLSFIIDSRMNLYEHQSTWNPNMPLRGLFYFTQQYEGLLGLADANIYGRKRIELPTPEYIVFYNGSDMSDDRKVLYLSDSFSEGRGSGCLECRCEIININRGHNKELMDKCRRLWEYSEFVSEIEAGILAGESREEAVQSAIDRCIARGILADVLKKEKSEVLRMIFLTEYDEKKHMRHVFEDGKEEKLLEQIRKKLAKGKGMEQIAEELEEDIETIRRLSRNEEHHGRQDRN